MKVNKLLVIFSVFLFFIITGEGIFLFLVTNKVKPLQIPVVHIQIPVMDFFAKKSIKNNNISKEFIAKIARQEIEEGIKIRLLTTYDGIIQQINRTHYVVQSGEYFGDISITNAEGNIMLKIALTSERLKKYKFYKVMQNGEKKLMSFNDIKEGQKINTTVGYEVDQNGKPQVLELIDNTLEIRD